MKALELARQLREEGFAVAVMQKQDHKQEAEYLGRRIYRASDRAGSFKRYDSGKHSEKRPY